MTTPRTFRIPRTSATMPPDTSADNGLWSRVLDREQRINPGMWARAIADSDIVGTCRVVRCGGYMHAGPAWETPETAGGWLYAHCTKCGQEIAAPGGRTLRTPQGKKGVGG